MSHFNDISEQEYKRRIRAWTMYDWANSAFATTILAAVLPVYYSQVAGATLPSASVATAYWSAGLSLSLFIIAILSPILGTISDVMRGKKRFLSIFFGFGVVATGLLVLVDTGDWILASILFIIGRIGFTGANVFYDALLPHVAREEDRDGISTRGYAMGYLGGGLLLAINIGMFEVFPGTWGYRLSFLSVGLWWAIFSIPVFTRIPEPPAATASLGPGENVVKAGFQRLWETIKDIRRYRELFKYLLAFLIYIDGIGTIIGVAAIYGAELGFGSTDLILALLLVQFVGIPYSLIFGRLPNKNETRRPFFLAFVLFNLIALPLSGLIGASALPSSVTGTPPEPFTTVGQYVGEGEYSVSGMEFSISGEWDPAIIPADILGTEDDRVYLMSQSAGDRLEFPFNGKRVELTYSAGPDHGIVAFEIDGKTVIDPDTGDPLTIDAYQPTERYGLTVEIAAKTAGEHVLTVVNTGENNFQSGGSTASVSQAIVLPPERSSNLLVIIGMVFGIELVGLALAWVLGPVLFSGVVQTLDTKRSILLALGVYTVIAIWGFFLNSVVEFWFLAWMVATVQGGSQALSRSLFSVMSPSTKSGEFFGLFGIMEKFSAILGPLVFAFAATTFGNSRPAVLSLILFFIIGGYLLTRVDVEAGRRVAKAEDAALMK